MKLEELASDSVFTVEATDVIDVALDLMEKHRIRHLPVLRDGTPVGMVSDRDLLFRVDGKRISERESQRDASVEVVGPTHIEAIMTTPLITLAPDDLAEKAARLMLQKGVHAIGVVGAGGICGMVTESDFLACYNEQRHISPRDRWWDQPVGNHMSRDLICITPREETLAALRLMRQWQVRHLPVMDGDDLIGILSDHDIRAGIARDTIQNVQDPQPQIALMEHHGIQNLMSRDVKSTLPDSPLSEAARLMLEGKFGSLAVLEEGRLVGIITETDLLRALVSACEGAA